MNDSPELEYVGFWLRVWASVIDSVLVVAITIPLLSGFLTFSNAGFR